MAGIDVITEITDSYELIKGHYKEVVVPIILLLLISGGAGGGGQMFSSWGNGSGSSSLVSNSLQGPLLPAAFSDAGAALAAVGGLLLALIAIAAVFLVALVLLDGALWLYVYEHFYSLLQKRKINRGWQDRMIRHGAKTLVMMVFWLIISVALFAIFAFLAWGAIQGVSGGDVGAVIASLGAVLLLLAVFALLGAVLMFLLTPLWVYYALDGKGFFESVGKSVSLVSGNLVAFLLLAAIFGLLYIGGIAAAIMTCCFSYVVGPIITVGLGLLWGVTLLKIKLKLDAKK